MGDNAAVATGDGGDATSGWHAALMAVVVAPLVAPLMPAIPLGLLTQVAEVTRMTRVQQVQVARVQQVQVPQVQSVHIRPRDCRVQLVTQAACALYWFNPLVWVAAAHVRSERERACDDEVLGFGAQPSSYAAHLLDIARDLRPSLRPTAALAMARPSELEGRLLAVLAAGRARVPARASRWAVGATFTFVTAITLGGSAGPRMRRVGAGVLVWPRRHPRACLA